jgi:release factor glutamine methyltransferase
LSPDVRDYEPEIALFAGDDGLSVIRRLIAEAPKYLAPTGKLILEIGATQADTGCCHTIYVAHVVPRGCSGG